MGAGNIAAYRSLALFQELGQTLGCRALHQSHHHGSGKYRHIAAAHSQSGILLGYLGLEFETCTYLNHRYDLPFTSGRVPGLI